MLEHCVIPLTNDAEQDRQTIDRLAQLGWELVIIVEYRDGPEAFFIRQRDAAGAEETPLERRERRAGLFGVASPPFSLS